MNSTSGLINAPAVSAPAQGNYQIIFSLQVIYRGVHQINKKQPPLVWHQQSQPLQQGPQMPGDTGACRSIPNPRTNQTSSTPITAGKCPPSRGLMLAGGRGPSNPRRLQVPHSLALFLSLAAEENPCCYATRVVGLEQSAHPTPGTH